MTKLHHSHGCRALELHCGAQILHEKLTAYYAAIQAVPALR